jgi:hypothetical protein
MKLKVLYTSVAAALMLGGATAALANGYYFIQPAATSGVVVQERVVTTPAQPVVVHGTPMTMAYTVDDAYPFPSPETRVVQSGVFVPTIPAESRAIATVPAQPATIEVRPERRWPDRNPNSD